MNIRAKLLCAVAVSGFVALAVTAPAQALTMQECSAKYQAAKTAGTLNGQSGTISAKPSAPRTLQQRPPPRPLPPRRPPAEPKAAEAKPKTEKAAAAPATAPASVGNAVFPSAVDPSSAKRNTVHGADAHLLRTMENQQGR